MAPKAGNRIPTPAKPANSGSVLMPFSTVSLVEVDLHAIVVGNADLATNRQDRRNADRAAGIGNAGDKALRLVGNGLQGLGRRDHRLELRGIDRADMNQRRHLAVA